MKQQIIIIILFFFAFHSTANAQSNWKEKIYADAKVGLAGGANSQLQFAAGYLLHKNHGIGLSYHREVAGNPYSFSGMRGLGVDYRYSTDFGLITKIGVGKMLDGWAAEDNATQFVYKSSKLFTDFSIEYQIRAGFTFGLYLTFSPEIVFDTYLLARDVEPYIDSDELVFQREEKEKFGNFGVSIGYALPWKSKQKKKKF